MGKALKPLVSDSVEHANDAPLPAGATAFSPDDHLTAVSGDALVVGQLRSRDATDSHRWLFVANRSHDDEAAATISVNTAHVASIQRFAPANGSYAAQRDAQHIGVQLAAGAAALYRLATR